MPCWSQASPRKAQIIQLSCGCHLMKTSINMGTLELTIWLCLLDGSAPHRSVGIEMAAANQLFLQLLLQPWRARVPSAMLLAAESTAEQGHSKRSSEPSHGILPLPAHQPLFPCRDSSQPAPQQLCEGDKPPLLLSASAQHQLQPFYQSQPHFSSSHLPLTHLFSSARHNFTVCWSKW